MMMMANLNGLWDWVGMAPCMGPLSPVCAYSLWAGLFPEKLVKLKKKTISRWCSFAEKAMIARARCQIGSIFPGLNTVFSPPPPPPPPRPSKAVQLGTG